MHRLAAASDGERHGMRPFKKLQENSLYWRYRFITRRWLAVKRWSRGVRQPSLRQVRHRGAPILVPQARATSVLGRGMAFLLATALALTVVQALLAGRVGGLGMSLLQLAIIVGMIYVFARQA